MEENEENNSDVVTIESNEQNNDEVKSDKNTDFQKFAEDLYSKLEEKFENKIKNITDDFTKANDELKETIKKKDDEIEQLKRKNATILLNSSVKQDNEEIDFSSVDFEDVDWSKQAENYIKSIDSKILG